MREEADTLKKHTYFDEDWDDYLVSLQKSSFSRLKEEMSGVRIYAEKWLGRLRRLTPQKAARILKKALIQAKELFSTVSIGFRAGTAFLLLAVIVVTPTVFYFVLSGDEQSQSKFNSEAAYVCTQIIGEYGTAKTEQADTQGALYNMTGLSFAREVDFNGDGTSELIVAFKSEGIYQVEIWGSSDGEFVCLYAQPANTLEDSQVGSWISLYRRSGKTYIGEFSEEDGTLSLLTLSGGAFSAQLECDYDAENDIYAFDGAINTADFETVRLSNMTAAKAEELLDSVTAAVESFGGVDSEAQEVAAQTDGS